MKKILIACVLGVTLTACGSSTEDDVSAAVEKAMTAVNDGDMEAFCSALAPTTKTKIEAAGGSCAEGAEKTFGTDKGTMNNVEVSGDKVTVDGDSATVPPDAVTYEDDKGEKVQENGEPLKMVRVDDKWYLDFPA